MSTTYGVVWCEGTLPPAAGKLELLPRRLRLDGLADAKPVGREIDYERLAAVRVGRAAADRVGGLPSVVLEPDGGAPIRVSTITQPSLVGELAERLTLLHLGARMGRRAAFVAPLVPEAHEKVRALLAGGPPFDPRDMPGLDRHEVFLTTDEVVFLFESSLGAAALETLIADPELWRAAAEWQAHLAGPPRLAENVYAWARPVDTVDPSLLPPGTRAWSEAMDDF